MRRRSADSAAPFARSRRREIARACSFGPRTAPEIARQLTTRTGAVTTVITALVNEGILRETTVPHAGGQAYELVEKWRPALLEAVGSAGPRGQLMPEHRVLVLGGRDAAAFARATALVAADPVVLWAARVDGLARLLVVARGGEGADHDQVDRLEATISQLGIDCIQLRVDRVLELAELVRYAKTLSHVLPAPAGELSTGG